MIERVISGDEKRSAARKILEALKDWLCYAIADAHEEYTDVVLRRIRRDKQILSQPRLQGI